MEFGSRFIKDVAGRWISVNLISCFGVRPSLQKEDCHEIYARVHDNSLLEADGYQTIVVSMFEDRGRAIQVLEHAMQYME